MPTSLPQSVRKHLGDQVADDFSRWFEENVQHELVTKDQYREVLSRLDVLEERFDHVEERFDRMEEHVEERLDLMEKHFEERFEQVDQRFEGMEERLDRRFEGMDEKLDRMNDRILSMTRWLIGLIALFGSLITVLLAIAQFGT